MYLCIFVVGTQSLYLWYFCLVNCVCESCKCLSLFLSTFISLYRCEFVHLCIFVVCTQSLYLCRVYTISVPLSCVHNLCICVSVYLCLMFCVWESCECFCLSYFCLVFCVCDSCACLSLPLLWVPCPLRGVARLV